MMLPKNKCLLSLLPAVLFFSASVSGQKFRHVENTVITPVEKVEETSAEIAAPEVDGYLQALIEQKISGPWIFNGYRHLTVPKKITLSPFAVTKDAWVYSEDVNYTDGEEEDTDAVGETNSLAQEELTITGKDVVPGWLRKRIERERVIDNILYGMMVTHPKVIDFAYWNLPTPPVLPDDDVSYGTYLRNMKIPGVDSVNAILPEVEIAKRHWIHKFSTGLQFSQAYVSSNWYQGGNNHLALLYNFFWDVQLNQVYHPNLMFNSTLQYKLGLNSNQDQYHKYSISEDIFQYNLKAGFKAFKRWFYSFTMQFKTQILNNYEQDSMVRKAAFMSPGDLNIGLGMTYNYENQYSTFKFSASIAPLSYNLKTCIDRWVDPVQFNIEAGRKTANKFGSSAECTLDWDMSKNINLRSRLFGFTDYSYFQGDLETTISFAINRFLSTQIYAHLRYDSSSELTQSKWNHWMLKEILSFGLTYTFATAP